MVETLRILAHAHTTFSHDGELSVQELAKLAHNHGFDAVLISDHFEDLTEKSFNELVNECKSNEECLMIPGYERNWSDYHILAYGIYNWFDDADFDTWIDMIRKSGGLVIFAHPAKNNFCIPEKVLVACDGIEIWNSKKIYDGSTVPNPWAIKLLKPDQIPFCGQDLHGTRHLTSVKINVQGSFKNVQEIIDSLRWKNFQISNYFMTFKRDSLFYNRVLLGLFHYIRRYVIDIAIRVIKYT